MWWLFFSGCQVVVSILNVSGSLPHIGGLGLGLNPKNLVDYL